MEAHSACTFSSQLGFGSSRCISKIVSWQCLGSDRSQGNSTQVPLLVPHCHRRYQPTNHQAWSGPVLSPSIHLVVVLAPVCPQPPASPLPSVFCSNLLTPRVTSFFLNSGPDPGLSLVWFCFHSFGSWCRFTYDPDLQLLPPHPPQGSCLETPCRALCRAAFRHLLILALRMSPPTIAKTSSNKQRIRVEKRYVNVQQQTNRQHYPEGLSKLELIWPQQ